MIQYDKKEIFYDNLQFYNWYEMDDYDRINVPIWEVGKDKFEIIYPGAYRINKFEG